MICLLALFAGAKPILFDTLDPDCFWHLRVAEQLRQDGIRPIVDSLSFNSLKMPWTPYSWLAELGMKAIWNIGGFRAAIATQAVLQAMFVMLLALCGRMLRRDNPLGVIVAVVIALFFSMPYFSFRPVTLAIDLLALISWLVLSDRQSATRWVYTVVPLTALLINVHFFALLVPLIFGALAVGNWIERKAKLRDWLLVLATTAACAATPMLTGLLRVMWHYQFADSAVEARLAAEFSPIYSGTFGKITAALLLVWLIALLRSPLRMGEKLWAVGFAVLLMRMGRFAPVFAPVGVATMAWLLPDFSTRVLERSSLRGTMSLILLIGVGRVIMAFPSSSTPLSSWLNRNGPDTPGYPTAAADYVATHIPAGNLLNDFSWGGYLEWRLGPTHPVFIDGRTQLFAAADWQKIAANDYAAIVQLPATAAIVPTTDSGMRRALIAAGWNVAFKDDRAQVLTPGDHVRGD